MSIKDVLASIFRNALNRDNSKKAWDNLQKGSSFTWTPKSDRYTYEKQYNTDYNSKWKPETSEEKKTLTPEGSFRIGDRATTRDVLRSEIYQKALNKGYSEEEANQQVEEELDKEKQFSINSTALSQVKYNPTTEELKVKFQGGNKEYFYPSVPKETVEDLLEAASKGEYFMGHIHDQYSLYGKDHRAKNKKEQKKIKKFQKKYNKNPNFYKGAIKNTRKSINKHRGIGK